MADKIDPKKYELLVFELQKPTAAAKIGVQILNSNDPHKYPVVTEVLQGSLAETAGIRLEDIIVAINQRRILADKQAVKALIGGVKIRIMVARKRIEEVPDDLIKPLDGIRKPGCAYKLLRIDPAFGGATFGVQFGPFDGKIAGVDVGEGWAKSAGFQKLDRPVAIGETAVTSIEQITNSIQGMTGEPVDWVIERDTQTGAHRAAAQTTNQ